MASKAVRGAGRRRMELWTLCFLWGLLLVGPHATAQSVARDQDEGGSHPPEVPEENVDSMFESEALLPIPKKPKNKPQTSGNAAGQPLFFEPGNPQSAGRSQVTPPLQQFLDVANADGSRGALLSKSGAENSEVRSQQRGTAPVEDRPSSRYSAASNRNSTAVVYSQSSGSATNKGSKADGTGERTAQTATLDTELSNPDSGIDDVLSAPPLEDDVLELEDLLPAPSRIRRSADNSIDQSGDGCADNSSCPATEECVSLSQGMYCVCRSGYVRPLGNGTVGDCIDIDECTEDTDNCTSLEVCQNTPGAYMCNCRDGYRRTNSQCSDINECAENTYNCTSLEVCQNTAGAYMCNCRDGYRRTNSQCNDINECFENTHNCSSLEVCQNTPGTFTCNCRDGYRRTNSQCSDINECADNNNCTSLEVCQNTPGAYICNCRAGYRRSINNQCTNINECAEGSHNCSPYQVCQDTQGSFVCGSVDLCASNRHTCTEFEVCLTTPGSFTCNCRDNFRRNSSGQCDPFYAYGYSEGDSTVAHYDDVTSPAIYTSLGLPVGESRQQRIYVGSNGIISFGQAYNPYYPPLPFQGGEALAPFWADINVYGYDDAQIFYHVYDGNGFNPDSRTQTTLDRATADVRLYMRRGNFRARWALVATWDNVPPYAYYYYYYYYDSRGSERITFQCVLVTDGQESYALYFYRTGAFNWNPLTQRRIVIGYTQPNNDFRMDMNSLRTTAYSMDQYRGNTGYRGFYVYKVGEAVSYAQSCLNWYYRNYGDYNFRFYQSFMPLCPCAPERLRWDRRWGSFYWWNNIYSCVQMRPQSWLYPYGKECCYLNGLFVSTMPNAGSAQRYHPWYDWRNNQVEDVKAKEDCCQRSPYCHLYYQLRPTGYCAFMSSFQEAALFGDPHILTLDGRSYTFNGWGEYSMLRVKTVNESFVLQGRTSLAETENGTTSNATIFSAFAAKDSQNASLHVELNTNKTGMIIYGAGIDHTAAFHDNPNFEHVTDTLVLSRENDSLAVSFSYSGISLTIHLGLKLLTLTVSMPTSYKGLTRGLLGNFNGNKTDDFQMRNGSILSDNATEEQIFTYFGNSWMITPNESVFRYPQRTRPGDFQHLDFKPIFLDQVDPDLVNRSYQVCGGKDNIACVYDFVATGSQQVAVQSRITSQDAETSQTTLGNNFPNLTASNYTLNVLVRQTIEFNLYGEDVDPTDTVTYFSIGNSTELSVNKSSGAVTYTPGDTTPTTLSFYAEDNGGLKSQVITIITIVCNNCSGNGACNYSDTNRAENNASNPNYRIATCECGIGWTGADCETDINSCAENPCLTGQNCTDLDPAAHQAQAAQRPTARPEELGYNCSACPQGYVIRDLKCQDFDECNNTADNTCGQRCINTPGSYSCDCFNGYRMVTDECQDVDECLESTDGCEQMCINQPGNFSCDCNFGYALKADGKTCNQTLDICTIFMPNCTYGCRNASSGNGLECFCPAGFQVNPADGISCIDVNECNQNPSPCLQTCTNSNGSFACSCYAGYTLNPDKVSCSACGDNRYGVNCDKTCQCGGRGVRCDPVTGCVCEAGWTGENCTQDFDECANNLTLCGTAQTCVNSVGSYQCRCPSGYTEVGRECQDVNECQDVDLNNCSQTQDCSNVVGSYLCICRSGYQGENCTDIDECASSVSGCQQVCQNVPGSFNCLCNWGYELGADRKSCQQVENVCATYGGLNCTQGCTVDAGSTTPYCFCNEGYQLATDDQTCLDIDECTSGSHRCSQTCENTMGNYRCSCRVGFSINADGRTCTPCDSNHWGSNCSNVCDCAMGAERCNSSTGCVCKPGWTGVKCEFDRNECDSTAVCPELADCFNTPGSYQCRCRAGYSLSNFTNTCEDVDECLSNPCDQLCENTVGSFVCKCNPGFTWNGTRCLDVDECANAQHGCQHFCRNAIGSYACYCRQGFTLSISDKRSCIGNTQCAPDHNCTHTCEVRQEGLDRVDLCTCHRGYRLAADNRTCLDVNECTEIRPCMQVCSNTPGSYNCSCQDGFSLQPDNINCRACEGRKWGPECRNNCTCDPARTLTCNATNGYCTCMPGWEGANCMRDIDECNSTSPYHVACPAHSTCNNTVGSYSCICDVGYKKNSSRLCEECDPKHWGLDCANPCSCALTASACNRVTGACTCRPGYIGADCATDINECATNATNCTAVDSNSQCRNTPGSYECVCVPGYRLSGGICQDINECLYPDTCQQTCTNREGSFACGCRSGYILVNTTTCQDVDECANSSLNTCQQTCTNTPGNFSCGCWPGYSAVNATHCQDINECTANSTLNTCEQRCTNEIGNFSCSCWSGYSLFNSTHCRDVDECAESSHNCTATQNCANFDGSFNCSCKPGYEPNGADCTDIDECASNSTHNCFRANEFCVNENGTFRCDCASGFFKVIDGCQDIDYCNDTSLCSGNNEACRNLVGSYECYCVPGFYNATGSCTDVDECMNGTHNCTALENCNNTVGGFMCECKTGYLRNGTKCEDVDECTNSSLNTCQQTCTNTPGNFSCGCWSGYSAVNATHCQDIDECATNSTLNTCEQRCNNDIGNFSCSCRTGYVLINFTHCRDIDECATNPCDQSCTNTDGSFQCGCLSGYVLFNSTHCQDVDECTNSSLNTCEQTCDNSPPGNFSCGCRSGFSLANATHCQDIDECQQDNDTCTSLENCINFDGGFNCTCKSGFIRNGSICEDVDECENNSLNCTGQAERCENTFGGFTCACVSGYERTGSACTDVDECLARTHNCTAPESCNNTVGGFTCPCKAGYVRNDTHCDDVDECMNNTHNCTQRENCYNTVGGFTCQCKAGYVRNDTRCDDIDECQQNNNCSSLEFCTNVDGGFNCTCMGGYTRDNGTCVDIDECQQNSCSSLEFCTNVDGGFNCTCMGGYTRDNGTCVDVNECTAGSHNCSERENCVNSNGGFSCTCKSGYLRNGTACSDIDECATNTTHNCTADHEYCFNTDGGFECNCEAGFFKVPNGCSSFDYCNDTSLCSGNNEACRNQLGGYECYCLPGFSNTTGTCADVDECLANTSTCTERENCINTPGNFTCQCKSGFVRNDTRCDDVDECMNNTHNCTVLENCQNTVGGFTCQCKAGYVRNDTRCDDVDECMNSTHNCTQRENCHNTVGGFTCQCKAGYVRNDTRCDDVDECMNNTHNCTVLENCQNTVGGFTCQCKAGYVRNDTRCDDVDECMNSTHNCTQRENCHNTVGGFTCQCKAGYVRNDTRCDDIDECATNTTHNCTADHEYCFNTDGGFECNCEAGFFKVPNGCSSFDYCNDTSLCSGNNEACRNLLGGYECYCLPGFSNTTGTCADVDECLANTSTCTERENCINTPGNFTCQCKSGFVRNDTRCDDVDECMNNTHNCTVLENCQNTVGGFTCQCKAGYMRNDTRCDDVDECMNNTHNCTQRENCHNTVGGFTCQCKAGYVRNDTRCDDVDECMNNTHNCTVLENCQNTVGGFTCQCKAGYMRNDTRCDDVDECMNNTHNCTVLENCQNTVGGFTCQCKAGYVRNGTSCDDVDECQNSSYCSTRQNCINNVGGYTCVCKSGYSKNGTDCDDINECTRGEHNCSGSDTCINTIGSFRCQCLEGSCTGLYSYGTAQGDLALSKSDDVTSPEIRLAVGFPVGSTRYSAIYVGSNGVISFDSPYNSPYPSVSVTSASKLIAPFWADIDIAGQTNSNIFYHVYDGSADSGEATAMLLRRASEDVRVAMAKQDFKAVWALVATWDSVPPYSTSPLSSYFSYLGSVARDGSERVTFQCVLVTDGQESFALVYYKLNSFTWRYKQGRRIVIGSVGVNDVFLETIHSLRTTAYGMDQLFGNTGIRGFWAYQVGKSVSYAQSCRDWYDRNRNDWLIRSNEWWIPMCPCAPERRFWDRRWGRMYSRGPYLCMSLRPQRWLWPLGKECCYYNGIFESSMPGAGSVYRYHPWYDYRSHQIEDVRAKENCCERSSLCKLYYELRPTGDCTRFVSWRPTALFGDPHILTLDGKSYTFNGWGEYTMLDVDTGNQTFVLQARTSLAVTENGTTSNATIFSAFAAKDSQNASLHVELDVNKTGMIIFGNERDHTAAFRNETFEYDDDTLALSRENGSLVVSFAQSGISLTISLGINMLTLTATLPITMKNTTKGLLGNFNDNATDDFLMRNGTYLPSNASEEDIFTYFGRDWEITQEESVFQYPAGQNSTHFQHPNFQPIFLDQVSEQLRNESYTVCGGRQNLACVYDYVATGSRRIASASNTSKESAVQAQILLTKEYPNIASLNETIRVQVNGSVNFTLSGQDPDSSIVYYFSSNTSDQVIINRTTGVVMYNPKSLRAESLSFYAVDGDGLKSPIVTADVVLCSGCSGHGTCNYSDTSRTDVNNASNPNFRLAACTCYIGWTGPDCESDFNACASNPCSQGQNCTDLDPAAHQAQTRPEELGYICSACPQGFQLQSGKCMDIDECNRTQSPCDQVCQNTDGSYVCLCRTGYRRNAGVCTDINECQEGTSGCEQGCTNTAGNFTCSCETGYNLQTDGKACVLTDENLCASIVCQYNCRRGASGSPECFCPIGKTLQSDGKTCQDIDECTAKPCAQTCTNTDPGFQCSCYAGYKLATDKVSCTPCEDNQYGEGCSQTCQCGERARGCDPVAGCQCHAGWMGQNCLEDVDECTSSPCVKANEICVNTPGTYECQCQPGYKKDGENCTNIDECSDVTLNNCTQGRVCRDTAGSYACDCLPGYGGPDCSDIDECATVLSGCEQNCINTDGSYRCECYLGYRLKSDRKTCEPDGSYPCGQQRNCSHGCTVKEEIQTCFCNSGYSLASDNRTCIDQDECVTSNTCSAGTNYCNNTPGGFTCSCPKGSSLEADLRTCRDCDNAHWGDSCTSECRCGVGGETCDRVEGCKCKSGFSNTDGKPCEDVDECKNSTTCGGGANCTNTVGSFRCTCSSGYTYNETTRRCVDVDECVSHSCAQVCHNTIGNYYCSCNAGFTGNGLQCEDIDECASNPCPNLEDCTNIPGSHRCSCNTTVYRYADNTCYYLKVYPVYVRLALVFVDTPAFKLQVKGWMKNHFNTKIGLNAVVDFTIYSITNGSTIVNGTVDVDKSVLAEPDDRVAAAVVETREGIPMGNGTTIPVDYIEFNDQQVTAATTKCEVYTEVLNNKCNDTYECVDTSGSPTCVPKDTGVYSVGLIIGLSVGIPFGLLFIIAVVTTIVYCRIKAKRKAAMEDPLNYYQNVRQAFGSSLPTRHHGKNKLLYQPDSLSSGSTGVGGQDRRLGRGRHDFKDSAWYDNSAALERGAQVEPRSNFSWDFMYDALPPDRQYNLPRPRVNLQPNETMTPSRQRPDSMA